MPLDFFRISVYFSLLILSSVQTSLAHSHGHSAQSKDRRQVGAAEERLEEAFEEQGYYLQRLFLEYGRNGTLTYQGLQKLLVSLGLGEVSVLEIRHGVVKHSSPSLAQIHQHLKEDHHHHHHPYPPQPSSTPPSNRLPEIEMNKATATTSTADVQVVLGGSSARRDEPPALLRTETPLLFSDHPTKKHLHGNCLNVTQLLWNFGLDRASHITPAHFSLLCPALLYQIDSGVCLRHTDRDVEGSRNSVAFLRALAWGSLALLVISVPSLVALGVTPLIPPTALRTFLCPMAAMAVGTLCGDALLHLLPHANSGPHGDHHDAVLKGLSALGGLYLLFVFESALSLKHSYKKSKKRKKTAAEIGEMEGLEASSSIPEHLVMPESGHGHSHAPPGQSSSSISTIAWMVVVGDGIHNLTDGLAIGVAFSQSLAGGFSTAIAVFCHELPHELGDLAMLLAAGWPVRRLALFSLLSALLGYMGMLVGTVLGHHWAQHSPWILSLTAGVFLYVALTDMTPEMLHGDGGSVNPVSRFLLQSVGLLAGGAIMLCIALFEENLSVNLGDG